MPKKPGPNTQAGIDRSCRNAVKHNMTSTQSIIPGEDPVALQELIAQWHEVYPTDNPVSGRAVESAAKSEWRLMRVERQVDQIHNELFENPLAAWSEKEHARYALMQRYATTHRREHDRDRRAVAPYRRQAHTEPSGLSAEPSAPPVKPETEAQAFERQRLLRKQNILHPDPKQKSDTMRRQDAFISVVDGETKTRLLPPTAELLTSLERAFDTTLVVRKLTFRVTPIPAEYAWIEECPAANRTGNGLLLPMTAQSFRVAVEREKEGPIQHWPDLELNDTPILQKLGVFAKDT